MKYFLRDLFEGDLVEYGLLRSLVIGKLNETNREMLKELKLAEDERLRVKDLASR